MHQAETAGDQDRAAPGQCGSVVAGDLGGKHHDGQGDHRFHRGDGHAQHIQRHQEQGNRVGQGKAGDGNQDPAQRAGDVEQAGKKQQVVYAAEYMFDPQREIIHDYPGKGLRRRDTPVRLTWIEYHAAHFPAPELDA